MKTLTQSPAYGMDTRETPATKNAEAAASQRVLGDICAFLIPKTFLTQEEMVLLHTGVCWLLLPKTKSTDDIHLTCSEKAQYSVGRPSCKKHNKVKTLE